MNTDVPPLKPLFDITPLLAAIDDGAVIITSNLRLSRKIRDAWNQHCQHQQFDTWPASTILPLEAWLQDCWLQLVDAAWFPALKAIPITAAEELLLWEQAVASDTELPPTANPENFADLGRRGWKLLRQWQIEDQLQHSHHRGTDHLLKWGRAVEARMASLEMLSAESRTQLVIAGFQQQVLAKVPTIVLVGFQTLPPLMEAALNAASDNLEFHQHPQRQGQCRAFAADTLDTELASAAHWAQRCAEQHPHARIGVVIPQLTALQKSVERVFRNRFQPHWCLPQTGYSAAPFNISAGTALAEAPVIAAALALLRLLTERQPTKALCHLLNNPFWSNGHSTAVSGEGDIRCRAQRELLDLGVHQFSTSRFRQLLANLEELNVEEFNAEELNLKEPGLEEPALNETTSETQNDRQQRLSQRLAKLATLQRTLKKNQSFQQWRDIFATSLDILGWPGQRSPDSLEYQQLQHWQELLTNFACMDRVAPPVSIDEALKRLTTLAEEAVFHPQTPDARIQILGVLEAAGLEFDYLWVMNMDDRRWPEATSPHPLLPVSLQRQLAMPRACPERELSLSRQLFELFTRSATEVIFSYSKRDGDIHLQPSALLNGIADIDLPAIDSAHPWQDIIANNGELEIVDDSLAPPFAPLDGRVRGGSRLLTDQAGCPFNAVAQWRLGAEALGEPRTGLSPQLRGALVHDSLDIFWGKLGSQQQLLALPEGERHQQLEQAVDQAFARLFSHSSLVTRTDIGERLLTLEQQRLLSLLDTWLQVEMERPAFTVEAAEKNLPLELGGLTMSLRVDRIDRLDATDSAGGLAIIDYKTGKTGISTVAAERLTEPQLPLYALAIEQATGQTPAAVSYALINRKTLGFDGIASTKDLIPGCQSLEDRQLPKDWPTTLEQWREKLCVLVDELRAGRADVTFYSRGAIDYGGHLEPLNRIASGGDIEDLKQQLGQSDKGATP